MGSLRSAPLSLLAAPIVAFPSSHSLLASVLSQLVLVLLLFYIGAIPIVTLYACILHALVLPLLDLLLLSPSFPLLIRFLPGFCVRIDLLPGVVDPGLYGDSADVYNILPYPI
ncbi:hypothetical protein C8R44DRAFT_873605 [Mycena epipterygia]|nr:hypothetical protein C8R44DRAFT_873605 [Mycena epipterygia]